MIATTDSLPAEELEGFKFLAIEAKELNSMSFAMLNEDHLMQKELEELIHTHDLKLKKTVECTSLETLVEMVKMDVGAAFIPACLAKDDLNYYSIKETVPKREIVVVHRREQYLSKAVVDLKELMKKLLG